MIHDRGEARTHTCLFGALVRNCNTAVVKPRYCTYLCSALAANTLTHYLQCALGSVIGCISEALDDEALLHGGVFYFLFRGSCNGDLRRVFAGYSGVGIGLRLLLHSGRSDCLRDWGELAAWDKKSRTGGDNRSNVEGQVSEHTWLAPRT